MVVVDSSAVVLALAGKPRDSTLIQRLAQAENLHAPQLIDVELLSVLRRLVATGQLRQKRAQQIREDFDALRIRRHQDRKLTNRVWELQGSLMPADAAFVVLAEALDVPLVTCDPRLGSATGHLARVELFGGAT